MKKIVYYFIILCLSCQWFAYTQYKENTNIEVAKIFQSGMVIQQNETICVWGKGEPFHEIIASLGKEKTKTIVDETGHWKVYFKKRKASYNALILRINNLVFSDILIGEVWLCSGQSNMVRNLGEAIGGMQEFDNSNKDYIRLLRLDHPRLVAKNGYTVKELNRSNTNDFFEGSWSNLSNVETSKFSAVGFQFGNQLNKALNVPVGLIQCAVGGSAINNWIPPEALKASILTSTLFEKDWFTNEDVDRGHRMRGLDAFQNIYDNNTPFFPGEFKYRWMCEPGFLFEAGIEYLSNFKFKGVLWYQGETDAITSNSVNRYKTLFPMMVEGWRKNFNNNDLPFVTVQLPRFSKNTWPEFRNNQRLLAESIPNCYMSTSIDLGLEDDIHPKDKIPIGNRVSKIALKHIYNLNIKDVDFKVKKLSKKKGGLYLKLTNSMKQINLYPGFELGDNQKGFRSVVPEKINAKTLKFTINSDDKIIRYAWAAYPKPDVKLFNSQQIPLGPFEIEIK